MSSNSGSGSAKWISIVVMVIGALMVIAGAVTYAQVSSTLADERITVSEDACLGGQSVSGPFAAYCEAQIIQTHALESTGGKTYAELDREDPLRQVAANALLPAGLAVHLGRRLRRSSHGDRRRDRVRPDRSRPAEPRRASGRREGRLAPQATMRGGSMRTRPSSSCQVSAGRLQLAMPDEAPLVECADVGALRRRNRQRLHTQREESLGSPRRRVGTQMRGGSSRTRPSSLCHVVSRRAAARDARRGPPRAAGRRPGRPRARRRGYGPPRARPRRP